MGIDFNSIYHNDSHPQKMKEDLKKIIEQIKSDSLLQFDVYLIAIRVKKYYGDNLDYALMGVNERIKERIKERKRPFRLEILDAVNYIADQMHPALLVFTKAEKEENEESFMLALLLTYILIAQL